MADMGYGLSRETNDNFKLVEKLNKTHPFTGDSAGRSWFDSFKHCHPQLTIRTLLPLHTVELYHTVNDFLSREYIWERVKFNFKTHVHF